MIGALKQEAAEAAARSVRAEEAVSHLESAAAVSRSRTLSLEGALRVKEREIERLTRLSEAAKVAEANMSARLARSEDTVRKLEGDLAAGRVRCAQLESSVRSKELGLEKLAKALDVQRREEHDMTLQASRTDEAARRLDGDLAALRSRILGADNLVKAKQHELERAGRQLEAANAEAHSQRLETELGAARAHALGLENGARTHAKEVERLSRLLDMTRRSEFEMSVKQAQAEEAAFSLADELSNIAKRVSQIDGTLKLKDREITRLRKQADDEHASLANMALQRSSAEEATRAALEDAVVAKQRAAVAEAATRARDREVSRLARQLAGSKGNDQEAATMRGQVEEMAAKLDADLVAANRRLVQLEGVLRSRDKDVERSQRSAEAAHAAEAVLALRLSEAEDAARKLEAEMAAMRAKLAQADSTTKARERQLERLERMLDSAKSEQLAAEGRRAEADESARRAAEEAAHARQRAVQAEGQLRGKEREVERLQRALDATQSSETEETVRRLDADLVATKQRATLLEGSLRGRDKDIDALQRQLDAAKDTEALTSAHKARVEEVCRKAEAEGAAARTRLHQVEGQLRNKCKEVERAQKALEIADAEALSHAARTDEFMQQLDAGMITKLRKALAASRETGHTSEAERLQGKEAAQQLDAQLAGLRQRILHLEGAIRAKDREVDKVQREMAAARAAEAEAEAATRAAEAEAAHLRQRLVQSESQGRAREREVSALQRRLEGARRDEHEAAAASLATEEAAHKVDADLVAMRAQLKAVEQSLHARDEELLRLSRRLDTTRGTESEMEAKASAVQEAFRVLDGELGSLKQRVVQMQAGMAAKDREISRLVKALEASKAAELAGEVRQQEAEAACTALRDHLTAAKQRGVQLESGLRARNREIDKAHKATEGSQAALNAAELRAAEAEECLRALEAEVALGRQRVAQAEAAWRVRDREVERLLRQLESRGGASAMEFKDASDLAHKLQHELSMARAKLAASETSCRAKDAECLRLNRLLDASRTSEAGLDSRRAAAEEAARKAEADAAAVRVRAAQAEGELRTLEAESNRLSAAIKLMESGAEDASADKARREEAMRNLQQALFVAEQRVSQLEAAVKAKERLVEASQKALENSRAEADKAGDALSQLQETVQRLEGELASHRSRVKHMESAAKVKDKEIEHLSRAMHAAQGEASGAEAAAGRDSSKLAEEVKRLEAALQQAKVRTTSLESSLATRDRELATLCSSEAGGRSLSEESVASAGQRAARAEEVARRSETEAVQCKAKAVHLEHALRSREASMDKLRAALADKVVKEERQAARDKQVYARLRSAFAAHRADLQGKNAAGSIAAASRELRPVEIVGVYEQQREGLETQLVAARTEVRLLSEQLRDAQNLISIKDRSGGWRNPHADSDVHGKVLALEKRAAMAARDLTAARTEGADALRGAERRLAEAERRAHMLAEENASVLAELQARPTVQDLRSAKREVDILERQLSKLKHGGGTSLGGSPQQQQLGHAGVVAEGGELDMGLATSSRASLSSRQRMRRDREVHRMGLRIVEDMSRAVLVDLLHLSQVLAAILDVLSSRTEPAVRAAGPPKTPADLVAAVQQLVAVEAQMLMGSSSMAVAEAALASAKPEDVMAGALRHFQNLFGCDSLAGIVPAMNKVYMNITEQQNFMHALGSLLGLDKQGSPSAPQAPVTTAACFSAVQALIHQQRHQQGSPRSPSSPSQSKLRRSSISSPSTPATLPPIPEGPEGLQAAQLEQIGGAEGMHALQHLMALFDAPSLPQACEAGERLVARLKRLDVVLPRYQSVASQLYEVLRVRTLDEIVPATMILVDVVLQQQQQQQQQSLMA
ncbi:hypothetical protein DUNSADRAFT_1797 [Dunaliella salina]|uniref:Centrosomal protein of 70 kDa n=1 Tax=Dunaliella salina TaxID=3046 RepID=A0ABQ7GWQ3_DUNSA|nr:hypothetical protein DUNSADRAFT_1797 [Dunaliella salina]|eukprot:KAF5839020.1 hypothetical protein DUNSADRAFT_1797 [Dunaliella salina]